MSETADAGRHRLFFALWPDEATRRGIAKLARAACERPVPTANLHMTLLFLGMQDDAALACFREAAGRVRAAPFDLTLDRLGGFARKRIQWLGCSAPPAALGKLVQALAEAVKVCGFEAEKRPFVPHITLSRKAKNPLGGEPGEVLSWTVREFVLAESEPTPDGVRYRVLDRWKL